VMANNLVDSGGRSVGTLLEISQGAVAGAAGGALGHAASKAVQAAVPVVRRAFGAAGKAMSEGCAGGSCSCFVAGTMVWTTEGQRPIETVQIGDRVLARSEATGALAWREVMRTYERFDKPILALNLEADVGVAEHLEVTSEHPFWARGRGWVGAGELLPGEQVLSAGRAWLRVGAATWVQGRHTVYNLEVAEDHSYAVGRFGAWVHNATYNPKGGPKQAPSRAPKRIQTDRKIRDKVWANNAAENGGEPTCTECGRRPLLRIQAKGGQELPENMGHVDHINPVAEGGTDELWNLRLTCRVCNGAKGAKPPNK
jgi:Pretoxin HINT domain/HNH endonuclease